jgi:hypothetical protein
MHDPILELQVVRPTTEQQFDEQTKLCRQRFLWKTINHGSPWHFMQSSLITEQIFEKTQRIQHDEENTIPQSLVKILPPQFIDLVNETVTGLIQLKSVGTKPEELSTSEALALYDEEIALLRALMLKKNHDYGEAWRDMRPTSFTDLILVKLIRIHQIEKHLGKTLVSEGIDAGYQDIVNYSIFALIRMSEHINCQQ